MEPFAVELCADDAGAFLISSYAPPLPAALVDRGGGNLLHRTLGRRADPCRRLTRNLAAALCLFVFSAQAASASLMAGRIVGVRGVDRERIVRIDWQYPWQLPPQFRNHCAFEVFTARPYCSNHCGSDYQFLYCSEASFGCCHVGRGYCDSSGLLRCHW